MTFKDILLNLDTYPDPASHETVDQAVALCARLGRSVTAVAAHVEIPLKSNGLADAFLKLTDLAEEEEARSLENARGLLGRFQAQAAACGVSEASLIARTALYAAADHLARMARTYDACVIPYGAEGGPQPALAEAVIFGSGRPAVIFKPTPGQAAREALEMIIVAWDGSRAAARAVADALPLLVAAKEVRILAVLNEKESVAAGGAAKLARHLGAHGVAAIVDEINAAGASIGVVIGEHVALQRPDLLVMGAFGHSRVREFILGGATQSILSDPPVPVLLSH